MPKSNTILRHEFNYKFAMLTLYASLKGIKFIVFCYTRTAEEQNQQFKKGLSNCDGYKKISLHQKDRARDIVIIDNDGSPVWTDDPRYHILGKFWEEMEGCVWGSRWYLEGKTKFNDVFHFEC